jgi:peptidoglycan/xylan/chitin deacetylase (PgdA/CDA1 family)/glycosyltransferase involved in cell wall biosynthesis
MLNTFFRIVARGKLTVLLFHKVPHSRSAYTPQDIDLSDFERVLATVTRLFCIIPLEDAVLALKAGNLPPRAACITFDDGYADWLPGVVPALLRKGVHATFFITTEQITGLPMWNERVLHAVAKLPAAMPLLQLPGSDLPPLVVATVADKASALIQLDQYLKYQAPTAREQLLQTLEKLVGVNPADVPRMTEQDLRALHSKGFGVGSHTVTHPILSRTNSAHALQELVQSREQLEAIISGKVTAFAYPNGVPDTDFGPEHVELVKRAGYSCAVTTLRGVANSNTSVFQIPRFTPWGPSDLKMELQLARNLLTPAKALLEPEADGALSKVLMVAFHFPPQAGSSGILRTLNFVKNLPQSGWQPTVLTANAHAYTEQRNDLVGSVPPRTRVLRAFALDAARHLSIANKYPGFIALPDRWVTWWPHAVMLGMREIRQQHPKLIWSTYPIATAHLIGGTLARLSGLPWVADFRDPMVSPAYPPGKLHRKAWQMLEAYVLRHAAACVFTTQRAADTYAQRYPTQAHKCQVIENGYDEEAFTGVQPNRFGTPPEKLLMLHSGLIYPKDRNPSTFFAAVKALIETGQLDRNRLCIRFRAPHHETEVKEFAAAYGLADVVDVAPPIPYRQAIAEMMGADLLLVFQGSYFNAQIPAKIYEYLRAQRPVFSVLDPDGDTAAQLGKFQGVYFGDISHQNEILKSMMDWLTKTGTKSEQVAYTSNLLIVKRYSRAAQSEHLCKLLSKCLK